MNDRLKILLLMIFYVPFAFIIIGAIILLPANDFSWVEGWLLIFVFFSYVFLYLLYYLIKDPEVIMKRAKYTTDDPTIVFMPDKLFMVLTVVVLGFVVIFPGLEHAANVTPFSWYIELVGFLGLIISLIAIMYINNVNRYASKGLVIHKDHELITSGPYRYIRHPMYVAFLIFFTSVPVALGSFFAFVVSLVMPFLMVYRIRIEEKMLVTHLAGYQEYMARVKYRLIPKIY